MTGVQTCALPISVGPEAIDPGPRRALQHEGHVLHGNAPVAVGYANHCGVVDQPIFRLHGAVVLGRVSWEREPFGERLVADAGAETRRADIVFFFQRQGSRQAVDPMAGVVFADSFAAT